MKKAGECARAEAEQVSTRTEDVKNRYFLSVKTRSVYQGRFIAHVELSGRQVTLNEFRWDCRVNFGPLAAV